ncbi:MAG: DUF1501 domain-containing protein [Bacteroidota bacterium]
MKRRNFLKNAAFSTAPMFLNSMPLGVFATPNMVENLSCTPDDRSIVIIHLNGANDGLNNLIPLNQMQLYSDYRPTIKFAENELLPLQAGLPDNQMVGLNPHMDDFKHLYDNGKLAIIQGAGYPSLNRSHFASGKLWAFGGDGATYKNNKRGFMANYLQNRYPFYEGEPFTDNLDPLGISMGTFEKTYYCSDTIYHTSLKGIDVNGFGSAINSRLGTQISDIPNTDQGTTLNHILAIENSVNLYSQRVSDTFAMGSNSPDVTYDNESLANQLKIIARLLSGGSKTKVFTAGKGGWDTHGGQTGRQNPLLKVTGKALRAFQEDLEKLQIADRVITVVFSEFGRKFRENGGQGTDHGTLGPMYVVGSAVNGGLYGTNPLLADEFLVKDAPNPATQLQFDYRNIFGTILQDFMGADNAAITATFQSLNFINTKPDLILPALKAGPDCQVDPIQGTAITLKAFLEGPMSGTLMNSNLSTDSLLPDKDPYTGLQTAYDEAFDAVDGAAIVDWIRVELRDVTNPAKLVAAKSALLQADGNIIDASGTAKVFFNDTPRGDYYVAIQHYNHLGVMTANPITFDDNTAFDFSNPNSAVFSNGAQAQMNVGGVMCLFAGDMNGDGTINAVDKNAYWKIEKDEDFVYGTSKADVNLDGVVDDTDKNTYWRANNSKQQQY